MNPNDQSRVLQQAVSEAVNSKTPLKIVGGNSKAFYGRESAGRLLNTGSHHGIINYQPSELVMTARAGTALSIIEQTLAEQRQMLAFEPPHFGAGATLGGVVACGFSGSRRPYTGSVRDFVLGAKIINGKAEILSFGGEVMKNVAGYDVSRLMVGAMGTLGVLLEISLKVLPRPELELTTCFELTTVSAVSKMTALATQSLPLSGMAYDGRVLHARVSGAEKAVHAAMAKIGGDPGIVHCSFWPDLNEQRQAFFQPDRNLWRIVVPPATPELMVTGDWFYDWGGGLRWLASEAPGADVFSAAAQAQGHAVLFRTTERTGDIFQPLAGKLQQLNRSLKQAFDPHGLFNPNRMYQDW